MDPVTQVAVSHLGGTPPQPEDTVCRNDFSDDRIPQCIRELKRIGEGSFGVVFSATYTDPNDEQHHNTSVAAKCIRLVPDSRRLLRVVRELEMLTYFQFSSQVVCLIKAVRCRSADQEEYLWLIMENVAYTLFDTYQGNPSHALQRLELKAVAYVIANVILSLSVLHCVDCVHRDLSPKNILLSDTLQAQLADFGLARFLAECETYSHDVVTLYYRAPEIALGCNRYHTPTDMWSVGILLAEQVLPGFLFCVTDRIPTTQNESLLNQIFTALGKPNAATRTAYETIGMPELAKQFIGKLQLQEENTSSDRPIWTEMHSAAVERFPGAPPEKVRSLVDLCQKLLVLNPDTRLTAEAALNHEFFNDLREYITVEIDHHNKQIKQLQKEHGHPRGIFFSGSTLEEISTRLNELAPLQTSSTL